MYRFLALVLFGLMAVGCSIASSATVPIDPRPTLQQEALSPAATIGIQPTETTNPSPTPNVEPLATDQHTATPQVDTTPAGDTAQPGAAGLDDPYDPLLGNGGYDALHYTVELAVDVDTNTISGITTLQAEAAQSLLAFNLDFVEFDISSVQVNGQSANYQWQDGELTITPASPLDKGQIFTTTIGYSGRPQPVRSQAIPFPLGWTHIGDSIYVASEPDGASSWYPVNDHPRDKATYTFRVNVDKPYMVAANGLLQDTIDNGSTTTYIWEASDPTASYLTTVNIAEYAIQTEEGPGGLPIRNFFPPDRLEEATFDFGRTAEMIELFSRLFGPYPFEAYGVAIVDFPAALETQTLSIFGERHISGTRRSESTVAHELAHQWFGDSVSLTNWQDIWLNEGFATYAEWLWLEHLEGAAALAEHTDRVHNLVNNQNFIPPGSPPANDLFNASVYVRGALTLHALRLTVGDDTFFDILRTYHQRYRYTDASTADFIAVAKEVSGQPLDALFDAWLYEEKIPDFPKSVHAR